MSHFGSGRINDLAEDLFDSCQGYKKHSGYNYAEIIMALTKNLETFVEYNLELAKHISTGEES